MVEDYIDPWLAKVRGAISESYRLYTTALETALAPLELSLEAIAANAQTSVGIGTAEAQRLIREAEANITVSIEQALALFDAGRRAGEREVKEAIAESEHDLSGFIQTAWIDLNSILRLFESDTKTSFGDIADLVTGSIGGTLAVLGDLLDTIATALGDAWTFFTETLTELSGLLIDIVTMDTEGMVESLLKMADVQAEVSKKMLERGVT